MTNRFGTLLLAGLVAGAFPAVAEGQRAGSTLGQATIEELMDIRVTSAARKSQRAEDVAAAMYVITRDDIRRSGLGTLPEILRLAPGVQVAQISASKWAISIRGFNDLYANKLLVLIDGRSVYTRTFSGVFWDMQDLLISDIDRIEIIRGPGGVTWGANAVNGVINIMTRTAMATQGLALDVSAGTFARERLGVRYGGTFGTASYRVFSQWSGHSDGGTAEVVPFADNWQSLTSGFRTDWSRGADAVVVQGHFTTNETRPGWLVLPSFEPGHAKTTDGVSHGNEASVLGRWTRTRADGTVLQVQAYHARLNRDETILHFREHSSDIELQYETRLASRHGVVLGGGFRHVDISADDTLTAQIGAHQLETVNVFVQDEIAIRRDLALTFGVKLEHDTFDSLEVLPTARMVWEASSRQRVWAAASRAHRTPSLTDRDFRINVDVLPGPGLPIVVAFLGNPEYRREELVQTEVGYRVRIGSVAAFDVTAFRGSYDGLSTVEPFPPAIEATPAPVHLVAGAAFANLRTARASGVELNAHWMPLPRWQIEASYAFLHLATEADPASLDTDLTDGNSAAHHWELRSTVTVRPGVQVGGSVSRVGRLNQLLVPAYTRVDGRLEWRLNRRLTAAAVGQNLLTGSHQEFASPLLFLTSGIPRSARLDLRWEF
jgi:iron complex outermembrane receptor protein